MYTTIATNSKEMSIFNVCKCDLTVNNKFVHKRDVRECAAPILNKWTSC